MKGVWIVGPIFCEPEDTTGSEGELAIGVFGIGWIVQTGLKEKIEEVFWEKMELRGEPGKGDLPPAMAHEF